MRKVRENLLVTHGNQALFATGTPVFDTATNSIKPLPGQLTLYDESSELAFDASDSATVDTNPTFVMAVPIDTTGSGFANTMRKSFGERMYGPYIRHATGQAARPGIPAIVDLMFECVACDTTYSFQVTWEDDRTQNVYPYNRPASETISVRTQCCEGCDDCTSSAQCSEIADKIVGFVNGTLRGANPGFDYKSAAAAARNRPYTAQRLYANTATACVEVTNGVVSVGGVADKITGITVGGVLIDVSACSPGATTPAAALPCIVDTVNAGLTTGSVVLTGAPGGGYSLLITSDDALVTPNGVTYATAGLVDFCSTGTPLADSGMDCGVRFASKDIVLECDCFPPNPPVSYKARDLDIAIGQDWVCGGAIKNVVQKTSEPENLGYEWLWREYVSDNGGMGRQHRPYNSQFGPLSLPIKGDRSKAAMLSGIDCQDTYCVYAFEHNIPFRDTGVHGNQVAPRGRTIVLIPSADAVTIADMEAFLATYLPSVNLPTITCS